MGKDKIIIKSYNQYWDFHRQYHYLFYIKNKLIGTYYIIDDGNTFDLAALYIQEEFRGKGYSKIMMDHIIEKYPKLYLQVHVDNKIAIDLYKKYKFEFTKKNNKDPRYSWMSNYKKNDE